MPLRFVLDEHLRGQLWTAIGRHNSLGVDPIDVVRLGDMDDLPLGSSDRAILDWAEREDRLVVSADKRTMPSHLAAHLAAGGHLPGLLIVREGFSWGDIVEALVLIAYVGNDVDYRDVAAFIP